MHIEFPEKGRSLTEVRNILTKIQNERVPYPPDTFSLYSTKPHMLALEAITLFLGLNQSNRGTHTRRKKEGKQNGLHSLEREVIFMLGHLMGSASVDGYITQGGSESNLMGLWIGRNKLRKQKRSKKKICLLKTVLTHFSIDKAVDILDVAKVVDVGLDDQYGMSTESLEETVQKLSAEGWKEFLVVLTLGYNTVGTIDPIDKVDVVLQKLEKETGIKTYTHLDAAVGGLLCPFISEKFYGFKYNSIQSITLDMHKTGFVPHTAGVFLCRKGLQKWVERPAPYLPQGIDDTASTTRPGSVAAACWSVLSVLGKDGFREIISEEMKTKEYFINLIKKNTKTLQPFFISHPSMNIVACSFDKFPQGKLPLSIEKKYRLYRIWLPIGIKKRKAAYPIVFMPHVGRKELKEFVEEIVRF